MRGTGSRRAIPAQESILPKTARPIGSGQIPNAIPLLKDYRSLLARYVAIYIDAFEVLKTDDAGR
jgi:hypothetical protein